jgi:hypothetical protein
VCPALDVAQDGLHAIEKAVHWIQQVNPLSYLSKNMIFINKLSFSTRLSASIDSTQKIYVDVTISQAKLIFDLKINLGNPIASAKKLALEAIRHLMRLTIPRYSKSSYDDPSDKSDYQLSGNILIF